MSKYNTISNFLFNNTTPILLPVVWPCKGQKWIRKVKLHLHAWVWRHPGHRSFLLANYYAMYASVSKTRPSWKIQNKYFYSPYSNEILYTKALEYREYFTHIAVQKMTKSSRDIQDLVDMKFRIFGQAVSKYMIVSLCVMFWRHLTPRSKGYFVRITMVAFI